MTCWAHRYAKFLDASRNYDDAFEESDSFTRGRKEVCRTSEKDLERIKSIKDALKNIQINNAASTNKPTFLTESTFSSENIHVAVEGIGNLQIPLDSETVEKMICISSMAKFGKGSETVQDLQVRNTQVIPASKLKVDINADSLSTLTQEISAGLNIDSNYTIVPHLYNMLIYGQAQFFDWHTDTEKIENMIATLVVVLPSYHKGGKLLIKHGFEYYEFASSEDSSRIKWIAFYSDCYHIIERVTEGFRVVLTYNIELKTPDLPFVSSSLEINRTLNKCVEEYFDGSDRPKKLMYLLNHSYSENSLKWHLLKGDDRIRGNALFVIAKEQNLVPCLALVIDEEFCVDLPCTWAEKCMSTAKIMFLVGENSEILLEQPSFPLEYGYDREICYIKPSIELCERFEFYGTGFSGNEATKKESRYHRACVVLCDASLISSSLTNTKLKSLTPEIIDAVCKLTDEPKNVEPEEEEEVYHKTKHQTIMVEGTFPSSDILVSVTEEGNLSYPLSGTTVHKLINLSTGEKRVEPHVILPKYVKIEMKDQVWENIISSISSGLKINSKCKLVSKFLGVGMYDSLHGTSGVGINAGYYCKYMYLNSYFKCYDCSDLSQGYFFSGNLKGKSGDITLAVILSGAQEKFRVAYASQSYFVSDWDEHQSVKYIACFNDFKIIKNCRDTMKLTEESKGTCLYLLYTLELQSELVMHHGIDTSIVDEPLRSAIRKYFSDDIKPKKIVYLLNYDYAKERLRWHMLKGFDEYEAHALYAVAKNLNLDPYLAYIEIKDYWSDAFSSTITETHVELLLLVDENNLELKPGSFQFDLVNVGEVCFTMKNKDQSKPIKIDELSVAETIHYYNRACVILCAKQ